MNARTACRLLVIAVLFKASTICHADTIIKLNLGNTGPDLGMNAGGLLSTIDDGNGATTGNQDTAIEFTGFLDAANPDITSPVASFTLNGLSASGSVQQLGTLALQNFAGGQFSLFDPSNNLLLSANLTSSVLSGAIGFPGTAAVFTTAPFSPLGGSFAPLIALGSMSLSISMTNVNSGAGLAVASNVLQPFQADASVLIAGGPWVNAPEPSALVLLAAGGLIALAARRR
jgi:hypothetical protein